MVPTDRFLDGLFAPHGGLDLVPALKSPNQLARVITEVIRAFTSPIRWVIEMLGRTPLRSDFVLCH